MITTTLVKAHQVDNIHLLITGATGGLGREACELALAWGYQVTAVGRNQAVLATLAEQGCETLKMDLRNLTQPATAKTMAEVLQTVDVVWHCAARSSPWGKYEDFYADNVIVTRELAQLTGESCVSQNLKTKTSDLTNLSSDSSPLKTTSLKTTLSKTSNETSRLKTNNSTNHKKKFIHISTPSLYCDYQHHRGVKETHQPTSHVNHYAHTKALAEGEIITAAKQYTDTHFVMLRPRAIFGRYDQVLLPRLMRVLEKKSRLPLPRGGLAMMDFTYAGNVVHTMQCATLNNDIATASVFNVSNHEPMALVTLIDQVFVQQLGMAVQIKDLPYGLLDTIARGLELTAKFTKKEPLFTRYSMSALHYDMVLDNTQATEVLGYQPIINMESAILETTAYIKEKIGNE